MCTLYKPPILACCSNVPCFTANRERRRVAGQLAAQENARYKVSYLRAFDPARSLHLESWVQRDMQKSSLTSFRGCDPGVANSCLVDLLIEPMPLERLSKKGDTPTFQLRSGEEVRLRALAGETLHLHGGVES